MGVSDVILLLAAGYVALGVAFACLFVRSGIGRIDHAANNAPWSFRFLIFPGVVALWPVMLTKWRRAVRSATNHEHTP